MYSLFCMRSLDSFGSIAIHPHSQRSESSGETKCIKYTLLLKLLFNLNFIIDAYKRSIRTNASYIFSLQGGYPIELFQPLQRIAHIWFNFNPSKDK